MTSLPVETNQNVPATNDETNPYIRYGDAANRTRIVGKLLKFNKFGDWVCGEDNEELPEDCELMADMDELYVGWLKWENGKPVEQEMGRLLDNYQPPRRTELGDNDKENWEADMNGVARDPWQYSNYLVLMDANEDLYTFATASKGGLQAIGVLSKAYGVGMRSHPAQFPIVRLGSGEYAHPNKAFGMIKIPKLEIIAWRSRQKIDRALGLIETDQVNREIENEPASQEPTPKPKPKNGPTASKLPKARF
jgi:hypothetical protein